MEKSLRTARKRKVRRRDEKFKWDPRFFLFCRCFVHIYEEQHISLLLLLFFFFFLFERGSELFSSASLNKEHGLGI